MKLHCGTDLCWTKKGDAKGRLKFEGPLCSAPVDLETIDWDDVDADALGCNPPPAGMFFGLPILNINS